MDLFGLFVEIALLAIGVYLYLFSRGMLKVKDKALQQKAEAFREGNAWWLRLGSLALIAIMIVNIFLHLQSFFF